MSNKNILQALQSAGGAGGAGLDVDGLFRTNLWEGNSSQRDIGGGINLNTTDTTVGYESIGLNYFTTAQLGQYGAEQYNLGKIIEDSSGSFYASLSFKNTGNNYTQNVITKFSSTGSQVWSYRVQDTSNPKYASIADILFNSAGNVVVYWTPAGTNSQTRINIIDKDTGTILSKANNSSTSTHIDSALQSGTNLYWVGKQNGKSLFINSDTTPATEVISRRVDLGSYTQRHMLIPQSDNEPVLVSTTSDSNSGSSTNGWVFTKLSSNLQSSEYITRHSHSNGSSTQYSSNPMSSGKQYYDPSDNMLYCLWYGVNSYSGNTSYVNYISKFDMDDGSHVTSKRYYFNAVSNNNISAKSITKFGNNIICVSSGNDGSATQHIIMEFDTSLNVVSSRKVQLPHYTDALEIHAGSSSLFYFMKQDNSQAEIRKFSEFDITESVLNVAPTTGGFTIANTSLTNTTTGYNNVSISFNSASDTMNSGSNLTTQTIPLVTSQASVPLVEEVGSGGLVWIKSRSSTREHHLFDTERGVNKAIKTNSTGQQQNTSGGLTSFNFNGFSLGTYADVNGTSYGDFASWSFGKAEKFFDIVTYTGDGTNNRSIAHSLGSTPGCVIVKRTSASENWIIYHRSLASNKMLTFTSNATTSSTISFDPTLMTSTTIGVNSDSSSNANGFTYVAYIFAHNDGDGDFGPDGNADIVKCGSYTGTGASQEIDLGFEAQWVLIKNTTNSQSWAIIDNMRGFTVEGLNDEILTPNSNSAEAPDNRVFPTSSGFGVHTSDYRFNGSGSNYIYVAIRRPTAVPEDATDVFAIDNEDSGSFNNPPLYISGFPVDFALRKQINGTANWAAVSRLTDTKWLRTNGTSAEDSVASYKFDFQDGWSSDAGWNGSIYSWMWKRAPNFCDVVTYTGNSTSGRTVSHNLGVAPEMMWFKCRSHTENWNVYHKDIDVHGDNAPATDLIYLNHTLAASNAGINTFQDTEPTASVFTLGSASHVNGTGRTYIAYLFASLDGISKVGSYTGNGGASQDIDCGFTSGARFVMVKAASGTGDWWIWDTERGITAGNDSSMRLNTTAAEVTTLDFIDPLSSGFTVVGSDSSRNGSGIEYIFYAIA